MIHRWLARLAALFLLSVAAKAETLDRYTDGPIYVAYGDTSRCTGFTFGGSVVMVPSHCAFADGARAPRSDLSVIAHMHNHGSRSGPDPKPFDRWFVTAVHVDPVLYDGIRDQGYSRDLPNRATPVFLQIATHDGAPDFDASTIGPTIQLYDSVFDLSQDKRFGRYAVVGYANTPAPAYALDRTICSGLEPRGNRFALTDCAGPGVPGGVVFDMGTGKVIGQITGSWNSDGAATMMAVPQRYLSDMEAMLDGQRGGFFELRTFDTTPDYRIMIDVWNKCDRTVNVGVRFKDAATDEWVTRGFYVVRPGRLSILPIATKNRVIYWTAYRDGDDYYAWRGDHNARYDGTTLEMIRVDGGDDWNDIRLQPAC